MKLPLLREPLLHFLVLGAALFGLFGVVGKKDAEAPTKIVVSASRVATLADGLPERGGDRRREEELQGLVEDYIRDEVFYREGRAAGLDRDDVVIRRRVRQKMEFLAEDMAAAEPTDEQLAAYLASQSGTVSQRGPADIPSNLPQCDAALQRDGRRRKRIAATLLRGHDAEPRRGGHRRCLSAR